MTAALHHTEESGFTRADIPNGPGDVNRYEIMDGMLLVNPPAGGRHQWTASELAATLRGQVPDGWKVVHEWGLGGVNGADFVPDIVVLRPGTPIDDSQWHDPADAEIVIEVASPLSTRGFDRGEKSKRYGMAGIPWLWLVDTKPLSIEVRKLHSDGSHDVHGVFIARLHLEEPFPIAFDLAALAP